MIEGSMRVINPRLAIFMGSERKVEAIGLSFTREGDGLFEICRNVVVQVYFFQINSKFIIKFLLLILLCVIVAISIFVCS